MTLINHLVNEAGDFFLTDNTRQANHLLNHGWSAAAANFRSIDEGANVAPVHHLVNDDQTLHQYSINPDTIKALQAKGWTDKGSAFQASTTAQKGLKPVYQLFNQEQDRYVYAWNDNIINSMISDGFQNQGVSWYSPVNTGNIKINQADLDPVTGKIKISYTLDELFLSQFRSKTNELTFRLTAINADPSQSIAENIGSRRLKFTKASENTGEIKGSLKLDLSQLLGGQSASDFESISLSVNSKYGSDPNAGDESYDQAVSSIAHFSGSESQKTSFSGTGSLKATNYANLYRPDGPYNDHTYTGLDLRGADFSGISFYNCTITNNNLTGANLNHAAAEVDTENSRYTFTTVKNNNMTSADLRGFSFAWDYLDSTNGPNLIDYAKTDSSFTLRTVDSDGPGLNAYASRLSIYNNSSETVDLFVSSNQFIIGSHSTDPWPPVSYAKLKPGESVFVPGYDLGAGSRDVTAAVRKGNGPLIAIDADNPAIGFATLYINNEEVRDQGSEGFIEWNYIGDDLGMKDWEVRIK